MEVIKGEQVFLSVCSVIIQNLGFISSPILTLSSGYRVEKITWISCKNSKIHLPSAKTAFHKAFLALETMN